ncbi:LysR family transcriptional regulator [Clostridium luticellarii]|jgi:DNA-binding transcriptional LysR family regulator|uniref:Hca operon transcriptional activator n=1 Tax=Clostridium luticellarii TaxID=1691940 RepID=A0A2T0BKQ3_9CLOT|nr:LysR family transcriptional regulator [Clostridium luticellarii]MCI1946172.1 LysR family transcriptional regulator [Clostridium luticellarii]MCI1969255.1 LysR family transcriptional regulator [Clostridium luticellarii]MCI1996945.1 LysR family transcriptional regulator [Clostridium luticellarii]MCI2040858.1 LysR family transcriptional regulator [Clostridium luticellarii]PRR84474.1 Hca operon transcriptional activator [Clostridium luticellarii]
MPISLLREFIVLSKNLNFSITAQQLYITQSVLSKHIALLEKKIGLTLLIRNHHGVELTAIGKLFLVEATAIVNRYDEGMKKVKMAVYGIKMELKIGYLYAQSRDILAASIRLFKKHYPYIELKLISCEYGKLAQKLKNNDLDLIMTVDFDKDILSWCDTCKLYEDILCAAVDINNPLAKLENVTIHELNSERILMPSNDNFNGYATFVNEMFNSEKLSQDRKIRYKCINSSLLMVEAGYGIAIVPRKLKANASEKVCFIPLKGGQYSFDVIAAWRKSNNNPAIKKFIQILSQVKYDFSCNERIKSF